MRGEYERKRERERERESAQVRTRRSLRVTLDDASPPPGSALTYVTFT
jgi:hypothetical protein